MMSMRMNTAGYNLPLPMKDSAKSDPTMFLGDALSHQTLLGTSVSNELCGESKEDIGSPSSKHLVFDMKLQLGNDLSGQEEAKLLTSKTEGMISQSRYMNIPIPLPVSPPLPPSKPVPKGQGKCDAGGRRSIFDSFWKTRSSPSVPPPVNMTTLKRTTSLPSSLCLGGDSPFDVLDREFAAPWDASPLLKQRDYYKPLDHLASKSVDELPELPLPLTRFYKNGTRACMGGAYPLNLATPILRGAVSDKFPTPSAPNSLILSPDNSANNLINSCATTTLPLHHQRVTFDPRITITEFDDHFERKWFSERELENFRLDTLVTAQKFFMKNPELLLLFNEPIIDPLTGVPHRRALFSLPLMSAELDDEEIDENDGNVAFLTRRSHATKTSNNSAMIDIVKEHVKKILIVDRNSLILDLLKRSIEPLFSHAQIIMVNSADEALRYFYESLQNPGQGFDIVIAEQRLHQPLATSKTPLIKSGKSYSNFQTVFPKVAVNRATLVRHGSFPRADGMTDSVASTSNITGAELFAKMVQAELYAFQSSNLFSTHKQGADQVVLSSANSSLHNRRALFIGLSIHPEQDEAIFVEKGADFVWGKPPPKMDRSLRDKLTLSLVNKRRDLEGVKHDINPLS